MQILLSQFMLRIYLQKIQHIRAETIECIILRQQRRLFCQMRHDILHLSETVFTVFLFRQFGTLIYSPQMQGLHQTSSRLGVFRRNCNIQAVILRQHTIPRIQPELLLNPSSAAEGKMRQIPIIPQRILDLHTIGCFPIRRRAERQLNSVQSGSRVCLIRNNDIIERISACRRVCQFYRCALFDRGPNISLISSITAFDKISQIRLCLFAAAHARLNLICIRIPASRSSALIYIICGKVTDGLFFLFICKTDVAAAALIHSIHRTLHIFRTLKQQLLNGTVIIQ